MISENKVKSVVKSLLNEMASDDIPYGDIANMLSNKEKENSIRLSPYGYILWVVDHFGYRSLWKNILSSTKSIDGYSAEAVKMRDDMPVMLLNAQVYVTKMLCNVADIDVCFKYLEGMTYPYVLYVLFAGSGSPEVVERYRPSMEETMKRYPSTLDLLPESYKKTGEEFIDADTEQC